MYVAISVRGWLYKFGVTAVSGNSYQEEITWGQMKLQNFREYNNMKYSILKTFHLRYS